MIENDQYIIVWGEPGTGFEYIGPFASYELAINFLKEGNFEQTDICGAWIDTIIPPRN